MHSHLVDEKRQGFLTRVLNLAHIYEVRALLVVEDVNCPMATDAKNAKMDVSLVFLKHADRQLRGRLSKRIVVFASRGTNRAAEDEFLAGCLDTLQRENDSRSPRDSTWKPVFSWPGASRLLQVADLVTSSITAVVAGREAISTSVFASAKALLARDGDITGEVGLKLHPYFMYANLYYWLLGDSHFRKHGTAFALPLAAYPYNSEPNTFRPGVPGNTS